MAAYSSDDEDLKTAIALSLQQSVQEESSVAKSNLANSRTLPSDHGLLEIPQTSRKRTIPISPPGPRKSTKIPRLEETSVDFASGARLNFISIPAPTDTPNYRPRIKQESPEPRVKQESNSTNHDTAPQQPQLKYPYGVVKKTWAFGHERDGNDIKIEEVLEPLTLRTAILSAFQWDLEWILSKLKLPATKCICVMHAKEENVRDHLRQQLQGLPFLKLCLPPMEGQTHCMHSKLMLLFHSHKLRIAIPTANLLHFDWGETGQMENSVFMIDLPRLPHGAKTQIDKLTSFGKELMFFIKKSGLEKQVRDGLLNFDFSATRDIAFVHSVGGMLYDEEAERSGSAGLARAVRELNLQSNQLEIDFAASSIGSLNDEFLRNVHNAGRGQDMFAGTMKKQQQAKSGFFSAQSSRQEQEADLYKGSKIRDAMRIYFPTQETVRASTAGAAGTICLAKRWFEANTFPRSCFRDYVSTRRGLLSHNKILCARGKQHSSSNDKTSTDVAWVYVGSANMSESAWGKLSFDAKQRKRKIACRNWECGVLLPVLPAAQTKMESSAEQSASSPVPDTQIKQEDSSTDSEPDDARVTAKQHADQNLSTPAVRSSTPQGQDQHADSETESEADEVAAPNKSAPAALVIDILPSMDVFESVIPLPFRIPGEHYGDRQPWYFKD